MKVNHVRIPEETDRVRYVPEVNMAFYNIECWRAFRREQHRNILDTMRTFVMPEEHLPRDVKRVHTWPLSTQGMRADMRKND